MKLQICLGLAGDTFAIDDVHPEDTISAVCSRIVAIMEPLESHAEERHVKLVGPLGELLRSNQPILQTQLQDAAFVTAVLVQPPAVYISGYYCIAVTCSGKIYTSRRPDAVWAKLQDTAVNHIYQTIRQCQEVPLPP